MIDGYPKPVHRSDVEQAAKRTSIDGLRHHATRSLCPMTREICAAELVVAMKRQTIREAIEALEASPCTFWACEGPDAPPRDYYTCSTCRSIQSLREELSGAN